MTHTLHTIAGNEAGSITVGRNTDSLNTDKSDRSIVCAYLPQEGTS